VILAALAGVAALTQGGVWVERNPDETLRCADTAPGIYRVAFGDWTVRIADGPAVSAFQIVQVERLSGGTIIDVTLADAAGGEGILRFLVEPDGDLVFERGAFDPGTDDSVVFADAGVRPDGLPIYTMGFCPGG
jgi:hypothetical protein